MEPWKIWAPDGPWMNPRKPPDPPKEEPKPDLTDAGQQLPPSGAQVWRAQMNYPFNLDELGAALDDFKAAVLGDVAEAHEENTRLVLLVQGLREFGLAMGRIADARRLEVEELKADLERYDGYIMGWRNIANDLDRELRETKKANVGLKRTIEELLRRPDLEEDELVVEKDPRTLAEIAREHGWL